MFVRRMLPAWVCLAVLASTWLPATAENGPEPKAPAFTGIARIDVISETPKLALTPGAATEGAKYANAQWLKDDAQKGCLSFEAEVPADAWKKIELTFTASADGKVRLQLMGEYHKRADAWVLFDNVRIAGTNLANGDFEDGKEVLDNWTFPMLAGAGIVADGTAQSSERHILVCHDLAAAQVFDVIKDTPVTVTAYARRLADAKPLSEFKPKDVDRWERDIRLFDMADVAKPVKPGTIVFVGSSSMRGWRTVVKDMEPLESINRGFGGSTMADVLKYMDRIVLKHKPRAVIVYEGDNDAAAGLPAATYLERCKTFARRIWEAQPGTPIYFLATKPSISRWRIWPLMNEYNKAVKAWCDATEGLTYIDVATPMLGEDGKPLPNIFAGDKLHMNAEGYKIWIQTVRPILIRDLGDSKE